MKKSNFLLQQIPFNNKTATFASINAINITAIHSGVKLYTEEEEANFN